MEDRGDLLWRTGRGFPGERWLSGDLKSVVREVDGNRGPGGDSQKREEHLEGPSAQRARYTFECLRKGQWSPNYFLCHEIQNLCDCLFFSFCCDDCIMRLGVKTRERAGDKRGGTVG